MKCVRNFVGCFCHLVCVIFTQPLLSVYCEIFTNKIGVIVLIDASFITQPPSHSEHAIHISFIRYTGASRYLEGFTIMATYRG